MRIVTILKRITFIITCIPAFLVCLLIIPTTLGIYHLVRWTLGYSTKSSDMPEHMDPQYTTEYCFCAYVDFLTKT